MNRWILLPFVSLAVFNSCQEDFDSHLKHEAQNYTLKHCPIQIDDETTFDSMTYDIGKRSLIRWYTFSGFLDTPAAHTTAIQNIDQLRSQLLKELRGDTSWNNCKDEQVSFSYVYSSATSQKMIFKITLSPTDYQR